MMRFVWVVLLAGFTSQVSSFRSTTLRVFQDCCDEHCGREISPIVLTLNESDVTSDSAFNYLSFADFLPNDRSSEDSFPNSQNSVCKARISCESATSLNISFYASTKDILKVFVLERVDASPYIGLQSFPEEEDTPQLKAIINATTTLMHFQKINHVIPPGKLFTFHVLRKHLLDKSLLHLNITLKAVPYHAIGSHGESVWHNKSPLLIVMVVCVVGAIICVAMWLLCRQLKRQREQNDVSISFTQGGNSTRDHVTMDVGSSMMGPPAYEDVAGHSGRSTPQFTSFDQVKRIRLESTSPPHSPSLPAHPMLIRQYIGQASISSSHIACSYPGQDPDHEGDVLTVSSMRSPMRRSRVISHTTIDRDSREILMEAPLRIHPSSQENASRPTSLFTPPADIFQEQ